MPAAGSEANGHAIIADDVRTYMPTLEAWSQLVGNFLWQVGYSHVWYVETVLLCTCILGQC